MYQFNVMLKQLHLDYATLTLDTVVPIYLDFLVQEPVRIGKNLAINIFNVENG